MDSKSTKKKPVLSIAQIWTIVLSLIGSIIVGFVFYQIQTTKRKPIFLINPLRSTVISYQETIDAIPDSLVSIINQNFNNDLNVLTFYFVNKGRKPIKAEDILKDITISFSNPDVRIINPQVLYSGREECKIRLSHLIAKNQIELKFKILEKNDGIIGQIAYTGDLNEQLLCEGTIEGVKKIKLSFSGIKELGPALVSSGFAFLFFLVTTTSKRFRRKMTKKYRMVLLNEEEFEEVGNMRLTRLNLIVLVGIVLILLIVITCVLLWGMGYLNSDANNFFAIPHIN